MRLHCNKTRSFRPITILITNQTKPPIDLICFDCLRETETALDSLAANRTQLSSTGSILIEMECKQMKSNENEITTHLNGFFAVPFTMTVKTIMISNQDCFDGEWNAFDINDKFANFSCLGMRRRVMFCVFSVFCILNNSICQNNGENH